MAECYSPRGLQHAPCRHPSSCGVLAMLSAVPCPCGAVAGPGAQPEALLLQMSPKKHEVKNIRLGIHIKNERWGRVLCLTQTCSLSREMFDDAPVELYLEKALQMQYTQTDWETAMVGWHPEALACGKDEVR